MVEAGLNEAGERPGALARVSGRRSGNPTVSAINTIAPFMGAIVFIVEIVGGMRTREGASVSQQSGELLGSERVKRPVE